MVRSNTRGNETVGGGAKRSTRTRNETVVGGAKNSTRTRNETVGGGAKRSTRTRNETVGGRAKKSTRIPPTAATQMACPLCATEFCYDRAERLWNLTSHGNVYIAVRSLLGSNGSRLSRLGFGQHFLPNSNVGRKLIRGSLFGRTYSWLC